MGESRLLLLGADLGITRPAPAAPPAPADERDRHAVPHAPSANPGSDRADDAGQFVPGDVREPDVVVTRPRMPITAAETRRVHVDDDTVDRRRRLFDVTHGGGDTDVVDDDRPHGAR
ncbi:hypothetical protein GCM10009532_22900 [Microbacterium aurantiacum]